MTKQWKDLTEAKLGQTLGMVRSLDFILSAKRSH